MTEVAAIPAREQLTAPQESILRVIAAAGDWGRPRARQTLEALRRRGLVKRGKRGGMYRLTRQGRAELARL